jgi:hypothetical protein
MRFSNIKAHSPYQSPFYEEIDGSSYNSENLSEPPVRPNIINTKDTLDTKKLNIQSENPFSKSVNYYQGMDCVSSCKTCLPYRILRFVSFFL